MKILYAALEFDKMNPLRGHSFEHNNFYDALKRMRGVELIYFPYERAIHIGKRKMNEELLETVQKEKPDLFFAFMYTDELDKKILGEIKKITKSVAWFSDDHWRFDNYSKYYASHFSWVVTTYSKVIEKYKAIGISNIIRSQWAANTNIYKPFSGEKDIDVSFIGSWNKEREKIINVLKTAGIEVEVWGSGWKNGRINQTKLVELIGRSKISLGLNPPSSYIGIKPMARLFFRRSGRLIVPDFWNFFKNLKEWQQKRIPQIKARHFEIPACASLLLTQDADDLSRYYEFDKEIIIYENVSDLIRKVKYYLKHDKEREQIAQLGLERTLSDHTYEKRFSEIFRIIKI